MDYDRQGYSNLFSSGTDTNYGLPRMFSLWVNSCLQPAPDLREYWFSFVRDTVSFDVFDFSLEIIILVFPGAIPALSSPYLNIDPSVFQEGPQYIFPEGASKQRGRFELAFSQIGGSVMLGLTYLVLLPLSELYRWI